MTAEKNYRISSFVTGLGIKAPCKVVTNVNLTLSGHQTVNTISVVAGDRVLVMHQTDAKENGIYAVEATAWNRAADFDGNRDIVKGTMVSIAYGVAGRSPVYKVTSSNPIEIGTSNINFSRASGEGITSVGDKDTSLSVNTAKRTLLMNAALTANRTVTLNTTDAVDGDKFRVVRTGLGGFTYDVGGLKTIPSATAAFVDVEYNGSGWVLTGYGLL